MLQMVINAFKVKDIRKKLFFTLFKTIFTPQLYKELNEGLLQKIKKFDEFYFVYAFSNKNR